jgi:uncharacterized protein (DUF3820 family)
MTDPSNIVPFGKYKGRLIEEVLIDDPAYIEWLAAQEWFRAKFTVLHQVIINRGAEPEETPDHNAMQVKFLDDGFCLRFIRLLFPNCDKNVFTRLEQRRKLNLEIIQKYLPFAEAGLKNQEQELARLQGQKELSGTYWIRHQEAECKKTSEKIVDLRELQEIFSSPPQVEYSFHRKFEERGVDVMLTVNISSKNHSHEYLPNDLPDPRVTVEYPTDDDWESMYWSRQLNIELKPTIGDDYPAVLRQMKRTNSDILFVDSYTGRGATEEQFIKTLETANIRVVFARDIG